MNGLSRRFPLLLSLLILTVFAAACGSSNNNKTTSSTTGTSGTAAATSAAATAGASTPGAAGAAGARPADAASDDQQILRASMVEPNYLDPHRSSFAQDISVERMMYRGLYQLDKDGKPVPAMATDLPTQQNGGISADGKTYTIKLKPGLKWSDGSPLTAKDFEYTALYELSPEVAGDYSYLLYSLENGQKYNESKATGAELDQVKATVGVKATDDTTIQFKLANVDPVFVTKLALWAMYPAKKDAVDKYGDKAFTDGGKQVGNGPYMLKEYKPKESITLVPNPNWALTPKPVLKELRLQFIDDLERGFDAYRNNELDMIYEAPPDKLTQIQGDSQLKNQFTKQQAFETRGLEMNEKVKPLDDPKVRSALAKAIDRDTLIKTVYQGAYISTEQWIPPGVPGITKQSYTEQKFDIDGAKKLLADAGFPNGQGFPTLKLVLRDSKDYRDVGEFLKTDFKKNLGINIDLDIVDGKTRSARFQKGDFDLYWGGWVQDFLDPENWVDGLWNTGGGNNHYAYSNPQVDDLFKQAKVELNNEKRLGLYQQINDIVNKTVGIANVYHGAFLWLTKPKVGGATPTANDAMLQGDGLPESWYMKK